jgi:hypothetical protein
MQLGNTYPIPVHEDGCLAVVECQVPGGELLTAEESSVSASIECQVGHKTTRTVVHEDSLQIELVNVQEFVEHCIRIYVLVERWHPHHRFAY